MILSSDTAEYRTTLAAALQAPSRELAETIVSHTFSWVADNPSRAELLMRLRTEDFAPGDWPTDIIERIQATNAALASDILELARNLQLNPLDATMAVIDIPATAARRSPLLRNPSATEHPRQRAIELVRMLLDTETPATKDRKTRRPL